MFAVKAGDFAGDFARDRALFQLSTFVSSDFAVADAKLGFKFPVFPIKLENKKRAAFHLRFAIQLVDLLAM